MGIVLNNFFIVQLFRGVCCSRRQPGLAVVRSSEGMDLEGMPAEW